MWGKAPVHTNKVKCESGLNFRKIFFVGRNTSSGYFLLGPLTSIFFLLLRRFFGGGGGGGSGRWGFRTIQELHAQPQSFLIPFSFPPCQDSWVWFWKWERQEIQPIPNIWISTYKSFFSLTMNHISRNIRSLLWNVFFIYAATVTLIPGAKVTFWASF